MSSGCPKPAAYPWPEDSGLVPFSCVPALAVAAVPLSLQCGKAKFNVALNQQGPNLSAPASRGWASFPEQVPSLWGYVRPVVSIL